VAAARCELAADLTGDLRSADAAIRQTRKKAAAAVRAAGTSLTGLFGVGPVIAAAVIGDVRHVSRFPNPRSLRRLHRHRPHRGVLRMNLTG
jgi:transposase